MDKSFSFIIGVMGIIWVSVLAAAVFTPYMVRKNICFGVSIPESEYHNPQISAMRRSYSISCLGIGLVMGIGSALCYARLPLESGVWIQMGGLFLYLAITTLIYFLMRLRIKAVKQESDWEMDTDVAGSIGGEPGKIINTGWYLLYLAVIAATVLVAAVKYPSLPQQIPIHYNFAGEVDRYGVKSAATFAVMPLMQFFMGLLFGGLNLGISKSRHRNNLKRAREFRRIMSISLFVIGFMVMLLFACIQLSMLSILSEAMTMVMPFIFLAAVFGIFIYLGVKVGQGGSRLRMEDEEPEDRVDDDRYWKGGFLYFNKDDPSLFVEKRFGMGYTLNFGNPKSTVVIAALVIFILAMAALPLIIK